MRRINHARHTRANHGAGHVESGDLHNNSGGSSSNSSNPFIFRPDPIFWSYAPAAAGAVNTKSEPGQGPSETHREDDPAPPRVMEWETQLHEGQTQLWMERSANPQLWDVTLATDDGHKILACRKDLCVFSEYFSCKFRGLWMQDGKDTVSVRDVPGVALENIIAAYYGCKVELSQENVAEYASTADQLLFNECTNVCLEFLRVSVSPATAVQYLSLSELVRGGKDRGYFLTYIAENIGAVRRATGLASLTVLQLISILESPRLQLAKEEDVLSCALEWLEGNGKATEDIPLHLFNTLRLDVLEIEALSSLARHPRVLGNAPCLQVLVDALVRRDKRVPKKLAMDHFLQRCAVPFVWKLPRQHLLKETSLESQPFWFQHAEWCLVAEVVDVSSAPLCQQQPQGKEGVVVMEPAGGRDPENGQGDAGGMHAVSL
eukprot:jgi/Botrbrau1/19620/Bobra.0879s0002.1